MPDKSFTVSIEGKDHLSPVMAATARNAEKLKKVVEEKAAEANSFMATLNETFGRSSEFTHVLHALEGGGPIAGLGMAAHMLSEMTDKARELSNQFREGKINAQELKSSLLSSIPVFGQMYDAADNILSILRGTADARADMLSDDKAMIVMTEDATRTMEEYREQAIKTRDSIADMAAEISKIGLTGDAQKIQEARDRENKANRAAVEEQKNLVAAADKQHKEAVNKLEADNQGRWYRALAAEDALKKAQKARDDDKSKSTVQMAKEDTAIRAAEGEVYNYRDILHVKNTLDVDRRLATEQAERDSQAKILKNREVLEAGLTQLRIEIGQRHQEMDAKASADAAKAQNDVIISSLRSKAKITKDAGEKAALESQARELEINTQTADKIAKINEELVKKNIAQKRDEALNQKEADRQIAEAKAKAVQDLKNNTAETDQKIALSRLEKSEGQANSEKDLNKATLDRLQAEADAGNQAASIELKRLQIAQQFNDRKQELLKLLADETGKVTAQQKAEAKAQLAGLTADQDRAQALERMKDTPKNSLRFKAEQNAGLLTGVAQQIDTQADPRLKAIFGTTSAVEAGNKLLAALLAALKDGPDIVVAAGAH
jgi:hypothetical protein